MMSSTLKYKLQRILEVEEGQFVLCDAPGGRLPYLTSKIILFIIKNIY